MERKIHPALLRLFVIFPNILSYVLLIGLVIFVTSNYAILQQSGALAMWLAIIAILAPAALFTTYRIRQKIKAGAM
ncbi:acyl-phosphate glycerol 3-phosphate acyltransferase [Metalysinibacillus jejuensis]|uniref:acyl-phosphate glycerol 3-phosphate acyltransferase n=1 Tax=Metalysinibacillus jejuensis TaxID=914327 RepID=UPI000D35700F|nr:acyl-phosphate glycerol 3-phosphate acyltransferase [Metalysinibacillus jejuensis]